MNQYQQTFKIRESECDNKSLMRLSALWELLQEVAGEHAAILGFGYESMQTRGTFWALMRMEATITRYPKWGEDVRIVTQPAGISKLLAIREYFVYDKDNNELVKAKSAWAIVEFRTMRVQRPNAYSNEHEFFSVEYPDGVPEKLSEINGEHVRDFHAEFCDIDINNHVNNSRYINWIENILVPRLGEKRISHICANYLAETKIGETLRAFEQDNIFELRNNENKVVFRAKGAVNEYEN
jgi:acyl-ACP thioesterase